MASTNNPTKFYTHLLYKAIFLSIFLLLLPLLPSESPNFINHTINTTSWELLQLVFVGIAVSYGLFSKRNNKDHKQESDNCYVTTLLQVSSVFDDESESQDQENSKVETWNSQYYRGEPIVVVANPNETTHEYDAATTIEKPLLLPVRSMKNGESSIMPARSNSRTRRRKLSGEKSPIPSEEENVVFRSPIPWRSRSQSQLSTSLSLESEQEDSSEINNPIQPQSRSFRYQSSTNPLSQDRIEIQSKLLQDGGWKNKSAIPPPPPPPPPPPHQPVKLNYRYSRMNKEFTRSLTNQDLHNRRGAELTIRSRSDASSISSFRIPKETEYDEYLSHDKEIERFIQRRGSHKNKLFTEETQENKKQSSDEMETGKDSEESQEEEDDELVELASKTNGKIDYSDNGPDVDKKADEFIAKFREQIRLQRIASIRSSTAQTPKNGTR